MRKFNFSRPARKKPQEPQQPPPAAIPMSKAHKILGSTPLSIDSSSIHDAPPPSVNVGMYESTTLDDLDFDLPGGQSRMARADDEWRKERGVSPSNLRLSALNDGMGYGAKNSPGTLKKAQSSSTMKSWHDKSKHSRSLSRQASIPIMNGFSSKTQQFPDTDGFNDPGKLRKKPPKLDFSSTGPAPRLSRKESDTFTPSMSNNTTKTPTASSPFTTAPHRQSDLRGMFKRRTKDSFRSFVPELSPSTAGEARRMTSQLSDNGLSTLYNHYEQMTFRHALNDDSDPTNDAVYKHDAADGQGEGEWREAQARQPNLDWLHKPLNESRESKVLAQSEYSSSPGEGARSVSSRHTRTSKASRQTDGGLQEADFHDKSVLLLSSDSEEDDDGKSSTKDHIPLPARRLPDPPSHNQSRSSRPRQVSNRESGGLPNKKTSFAPSNTYIAIPSAERKRLSPSPSRLNPPFRDDGRAPSPKPSLGSTNSTGSGMTSQIGYGAEDSPPVTVLPARRPSQAELDRQKALAQLTSGSGGSSLRRESATTSSDQLDHPTPPLSPSSVNFYLRSARSSIDDSNNQGRIMALTRQEEMLISALRKKTQAMRERAQLGSAGKPQPDSRQGKRHVSSPTQVMVTDSMLDFDFPAPPSHGSIKQRQSAASSMLSAPITEHPYSEDDQYRAPSRLTADTSSERASFVSSIRSPEEYGEQQDVLVYLDQGKHSNARWSQDGRPLEDGAMPSGFHAISWDYPEDKRTSKLKSRGSRQQVQADTSSPGSKLTRLSEDGGEDVPRPDSPISNDTFPQPRQQRRAVLNTARLSAVGFVRRDPELGWWGDDD